MTQKEIKQFKLTTGDEIICEIIEWDTEENPSIVVRGSFKIISMDDIARGVRFFSFRPWLIFQDDPELLQTINSVHIVSEAMPSEEIIKQYNKVVIKLKKAFTKDKGVANIAEDDVFEFFTNEIQSLDSSSDNIINFPNPKGKTIH